MLGGVADGRLHLEECINDGYENYSHYVEPMDYSQKHPIYSCFTNKSIRISHRIPIMIGVAAKPPVGEAAGRQHMKTMMMQLARHLAVRFFCLRRCFRFIGWCRWRCGLLKRFTDYRNFAGDVHRHWHLCIQCPALWKRQSGIDSDGSKSANPMFFQTVPICHRGFWSHTKYSALRFA